MAEGKKSVLLYCDLIHTIEKMDDKTAGEFFKHYLRYINDQNPVTDNIIIDLTFEPVKQNLKRDLVKYQEVKDKRSKAGKESARIRAMNKSKQNQTSVESVEQVATNPTVKDTVNVTVTDTVNVIDINKNINTSDVKTSKSSIDFKNLLLFINNKTGRKFKVINESVKNKYKARLKDGYTNDDIANAIKNSINDEYHKNTNYKYLTPEFFSRSTILDKHGFKTDVKKQGTATKEKFNGNVFNDI